jgi:hypothetical protein
MVAANSGLATVTPANGNVTLWVWLGASMLLAAARGYPGCEVLAVSNMLTGRTDQIGCILYTPIDRWETAHTTERRPAAASNWRAPSHLQNNSIGWRRDPGAAQPPEHPE